MYSVVKQALSPAWQHLLFFFGTESKLVGNMFGDTRNSAFMFCRKSENWKHKSLIIRNGQCRDAPK